MAIKSLTLRPPGPLRQAVAGLFMLAAAMTAIGLTVEVAHRLRLFWFSYNGQPGMNHVGDGYFGIVYLAGTTGLVMGLAAAWMLRGRLWRVMAGVLGVLNAGLCVEFLVMHTTATLVTYSEFVTIHGP